MPTDRCWASATWKTTGTSTSSTSHRKPKACAALEARALHLRVPRIFVEASELSRPLFERRGFLMQGRNALSLGGVAIHNYRMEKRLPA